MTDWVDDEELRVPVLAVHFVDDVFDRIECRYCGETLDGDALTQLLYDTLKRPGAMTL
jgi:hypothetical protein